MTNKNWGRRWLKKKSVSIKRVTVVKYRLHLQGV